MNKSRMFLVLILTFSWPAVGVAPGGRATAHALTPSPPPGDSPMLSRAPRLRGDGRIGARA